MVAHHCCEFYIDLRPTCVHAFVCSSEAQCSAVNTVIVGIYGANQSVKDAMWYSKHKDSDRQAFKPQQDILCDASLMHYLAARSWNKLDCACRPSTGDGRRWTKCNYCASWVTLTGKRLAAIILYSYEYLQYWYGVRGQVPRKRKGVTRHWRVSNQASSYREDCLYRR